MTARALIVTVFFMGIALRSSAVDLTELDGVRKRVDALLPELRSGLEIERIKETPVPGLYEVLLNGNRTLYISADGNYFLVGDMYEVSSEGIVNLPELARQKKRKELMAWFASHCERLYRRRLHILSKTPSGDARVP